MAASSNGNGHAPVTEVAKAPSFAEAGHTGLRRHDGYVLEEWMPRLQGQRGMSLFREMNDNEPVLGAFTFSATMMVLTVSWNLRSANDSPAANEASDFIQSVLFEDMDTPWNHVIMEGMSMLPFGWSALEMVLKYRRGPNAPRPHTSKFSDGRIGIRKLAPRSQDSLIRWDIDEFGELRGMIQSGPSGEEVHIPVEKLLHFRSLSYKDNPEGYSMFRRAFKPYWRKKRTEEIESIGIERNLNGYPVVRVPGEILSPGATGDLAAAKAEWQKVVRDIRVDEQHGLLIPSDVDPDSKTPLYDIDLLSSNARPIDTSPIIGRYSMEMLQSVLFEVSMIGQQGPGSFALASAKTNLYALAISAWLDELAAPFNRVLIPELMRLNGLDAELTPTLIHGDIEKQDLGQWAQALLRLSQAGVPMPTGTEFARFVREMLGAPEPSGNDEEFVVPSVDVSPEESEGGETEATIGAPTIS